jgi:hypothetical protein
MSGTKNKIICIEKFVGDTWGFIRCIGKEKVEDFCFV